MVSGISSNTHRVLVASTLHTRPIFQFVEITEQFTRDCLQNLKLGKSTGLDNMPAGLMNDSADIIAGPLAKSLICLWLMVNSRLNVKQHVSCHY